MSVTDWSAACSSWMAMTPRRASSSRRAVAYAPSIFASRPSRSAVNGASADFTCLPTAIHSCTTFKSIIERSAKATRASGCATARPSRLTTKTTGKPRSSSSLSLSAVCCCTAEKTSWKETMATMAATTSFPSPPPITGAATVRPIS